MAVKAKFFINSITTSPASGGGQVSLSAVSRGERNKDWALYTPSGTLTMSIKAGPAFDFFQQIVADKQAGTIAYPEVYLTIERATEDE